MGEIRYLTSKCPIWIPKLSIKNLKISSTSSILLPKINNALIFVLRNIENGKN